MRTVPAPLRRLAILGVLSACVPSHTPPDPNTTAPGDVTPAPGDSVVATGDDTPAGDTTPTPTLTVTCPPPSAGPALWFTCSVTGEATAHLTLEIGGGALFGIAGHVTYDATRVAVEASRVAAVPGFDTLRQEAARLLVPHPGDLAFGLTQLGRDHGDLSLDTAAALLELDVRVLAPGDTELRLDQVVWRRADGSFVPAQRGLAAIHRSPAPGDRR